MSIAALKKRSAQSLEKYKDELQNTNQNSYVDERIWNCPFDTEKGIGTATIRFLPAMEGEDIPWIKTYSHGFKGPTGQWYFEESLSTIGEKDPVNKLAA